MQKIAQIEKVKEQAVHELKNEKSKNHQRLSQLEQKLINTQEQNKLMSQSLIQSNALKSSSHLGINTHNLTEDNTRHKIGDYSDLKQFNPQTTGSKSSKQPSKYENMNKPNGRS
jgi:hypothetical protein